MNAGSSPFRGSGARTAHRQLEETEVTRTALSGFAMLAMIAATPVIAASVATKGVQIPGAPLTHIRDFYAQSDKVLYVRAQNREWYKAEMAAPCWGLPQSDHLK